MIKKKIKIKNIPHKQDIDRPRGRHIHKYTKHDVSR